MIKSGQILNGKYRIFRPLASGDRGEIWVAHDENFGQEVVIKFIKSDLIEITSSLREAFRKEIFILRQIIHPSLPRVLDYFEIQNSQFIVMDFIKGMKIGEIFDCNNDFSQNNCFPLIKFLKFAVELTEIVKFLHVHTPPLIHRDIKPENLRVNSEGKLFLLDFGIAKGFTKDNSEKSIFAYTLPYASPEQISSSGTTERSDIYSLGATFYHILLGCRSLPPSASDRLREISESGLDPLKPINSLNSSVPAGISEVISKAMALNPSDRFDSASSLLMSLESQLQKLQSSKVQIPEPLIPSDEIFHLGEDVVQIQASSPGDLSFQERNPGQTDNLHPIAQAKFGIEFSKIQAGSFNMGSLNGPPDEKPKHEVIISKSFFLGTFPITQHQWEMVLKTENPSHFKNCPDNPVENVSWLDAENFLEKLNLLNDVFFYRLPTEAEWEYACRATTQGEYYGLVDNISWHSGNSNFKTQKVGIKNPNLFGLYDMSGNVWEWCQDWYDETFYRISDKVDPQGPKNGSYKVLRGGAWNYAPQSCRTSTRLKLAPDVRRRYVGFRILAILKPDLNPK